MEIDIRVRDEARGGVNVKTKLDENEIQAVGSYRVTRMVIAISVARCK